MSKLLLQLQKLKYKMKELSVQTYLRERSMDFEQLSKTYGISCVFSETDNRVILNYSMIDSPKDSKLVSECRGLTLDKTDGSIVARAFDRFFNYGEIRRIDNAFDFNNCTVTHKEDGSLALLYYYNGVWHVSTRGSFGSGNICEGMTWRELFYTAFPVEKLKWLDTNYVHVFELCSRYNKVVRDYPTPTVFLLSLYDLKNNKEVEYDRVNSYANNISVARPKSITCSGIDTALTYIEEQEATDKTFEGLVLRDINGLRIKVKSASYVALHRLSNNHQLTLERVWKIMYDNEQAEFCLYFPELKHIFDKCEEIQTKMRVEFGELYQLASPEITQKDFANKVKDSIYAPACFAMRKYNSIPDETWFKIFSKLYTREKVASELAEQAQELNMGY